MGQNQAGRATGGKSHRDQVYQVLVNLVSVASSRGQEYAEIDLASVARLGERGRVK